MGRKNAQLTVKKRVPKTDDHAPGDLCLRPLTQTNRRIGDEELINS